MLERNFDNYFLFVQKTQTNVMSRQHCLFLFDVYNRETNLVKGFGAAVRK